MGSITQLQKFINSSNIADGLDEDKLTAIATEVLEGYNIDKQSCQEWKDKMDKSLAIAKQLMEKKDTPWPNASNVKYPLLPVACLQFNSRMYPEVIKGDKAVKTLTFGPDPDGQIAKFADMISKHMSYQLLEDIQNWEEDEDKLLMVLPLFGHVFKKVYYDALNNKPAITFCLPQEVIVNQSVQNLKSARRITHVIKMYANDIKERVNAGLFLEQDIATLHIVAQPDTDTLFNTQLKENPSLGQVPPDENYLHELIEQQCWADLDEDGYKEPYIVTVDVASRKLLRIVANYDSDTILVKEGKLIKIDPVGYFVDYKYLPSTDGTYYGIGFGQLLYPLNEAVNTLFNQLIDAGTIANRGGGFIDERSGWTMGNETVKQGQYKKVRVPPGASLSQLIYDLPIRDPSNVLFQLLGMLVQSAKEISNVSDVLQGQQPAQNVPATTVLALIEQGQKVYSAIQKRIYLSMRNELQLLGNLNKKHKDEPEYFGNAINLGLINPAVYELENVAVYPLIDPSMSSQAMRLAKAQALLQVANDPLFNKWEIYREYLEAIGVENISKVLPQPQPPTPSPADQKILAEISLLNMQKADILFNMDVKAYKYLLDQKQLEVNAAQVAAQAKQMEHNTVIAHEQIALELEKLIQERGFKTLESDLAIATALLARTGQETEKGIIAESQPAQETVAEKAAVLAPSPGMKEMPIPSEVAAAKAQQAAKMQQAAQQQAQEGAPQEGTPEPNAAAPLPSPAEGDNMGSIPTTNNPAKPSPEGTQELINQGKI